MPTTDPQVLPYPLCFESILKEKVWGGRRLLSFGKKLPAQGLFGESWEIADLASTSPSGGGGQSARSIITNGLLAGQTLHDAVVLWSDRLLGLAQPTTDNGFPLLVKFLDAREHLSVQVHPSPAYAKAHPEAHLKTECWFVLDAAPDSVIYKGVKPGVTRADFGNALGKGQGEGVVELLDTVRARIGDCHNLPSGTVHALGAGVLVAEVQTPSDTTFRVYDWAKEYNRAGRELHIEQALACIDFSAAAPAVRLPDDAPLGKLLSTPFYTVTQLRANATMQLGTGTCAAVLCTNGVIRVGTETLGRGSVMLVPATIQTQLRTEKDGSALVLHL